jgi:hypothetical protein
MRPQRDISPTYVAEVLAGLPTREAGVKIRAAAVKKSLRQASSAVVRVLIALVSILWSPELWRSA